MKKIESRQKWIILIATTIFVTLLILLLFLLLPIMRYTPSISKFTYNLFESLVGLLSLFILPILLYIIFIKILILFKKKSVLIGGIIGSIIGFFYMFIIYNLPKNFEVALIIMKPLHSLTKMIFSTWMGFGGAGLAIIYLIVFTFAYGLIGALIGFMIQKVKKN